MQRCFNTIAERLFSYKSPPKADGQQPAPRLPSSTAPHLGRRNQLRRVLIAGIASKDSGGRGCATWRRCTASSRRATYRQCADIKLLTQTRGLQPRARLARYCVFSRYWAAWCTWRALRYTVRTATQAPSMYRDMFEAAGISPNLGSQFRDLGRFGLRQDLT